MTNSFIPIILVFLIAFMAFNFWRQKKVRDQTQQRNNKLVPGTRIMTTSGVFGTIVGFPDEKTMSVEIAPGVVTQWLKLAIREVVDTPAPDTATDQYQAPAPDAATGYTQEITETSDSTVPYEAEPIENHQPHKDDKNN